LEVVKINNKPIIGVTGGYIFKNSLNNGIYAYLDILEVITNNGGVPIIIPYVNKKASIEALKLCHGVILTGGEDVDPSFYQQDPHINLGVTVPRRDLSEINIANFAFNKKIPLFGICRGMHIMNVALGGTLIQDINSQLNSSIKHNQKTDKSTQTHYITINEKSDIYKIIRKNNIKVNSIHHQALEDTSDSLTIVAKSSDNVIEAVEYSSDFFSIGVQWHPEWLAASDPDMNELFLQFIKHCKNTGNNNP